MATYDDLVAEIATRFDLGPKADAVLKEVLGLIAAQPAGLRGFLEKFKEAGLLEKARSWLGGPYPMALSTGQVKMALGAEAIKRIEDSAGLTENAAGRILGYAIPKTVVWLAQGGPIPVEVRARLPAFRGPALTVPAGLRLGREGGEVTLARLVFPAAAFVMTLGLFGYAIYLGTASDQAPVQSAFRVAQIRPTPFQRTSMLALKPSSIEAGPAATAVSGVSSPSSASVRGDFAANAGWIKNLQAEFERFGGNATQMLFAAKGFDPEETMPPAPRARMIGSLASDRLPQFVAASITGSGPAGIGTIAPPTLALASVGKEQSATSSLEAALQSMIIDFPSGSARILPRSVHLLRRAAAMIKQLPAGTVVEVNGYTDSQGNPAANMRLSEQRAEAVSRALVREGVDPAMLKAKGFGEAPAVASAGGAMEGRSSTTTERAKLSERRVEFHIVQQQP